MFVLCTSVHGPMLIGSFASETDTGRGGVGVLFLIAIAGAVVVNCVFLVTLGRLDFLMGVLVVDGTLFINGGGAIADTFLGVLLFVAWGVVIGLVADLVAVSIAGLVVGFVVGLVVTAGIFFLISFLAGVIFGVAVGAVCAGVTRVCADGIEEVVSLGVLAQEERLNNALTINAMETKRIMGNP